MNKFIIITTLLITGFLSAQISENRDVADFSKLKASTGIEVFYTISDVKSIKVITDLQENLHYIKTNVENNTLNIYIEKDLSKRELKKSKRRHGRNGNGTNNLKFKILKVIVSGPNLNAIKASSSGFVKLENLNTSDNLDIAVSSSGSIKGNFECKNLKIDASSSGEFVAEVVSKSAMIESSSSSMVTLEGKAVELNVKASSSGDCNLKEFKVENAVVLASSSASVAVTVTNSVEAKASSSADVVVYGNPENLTKEVSSSGSVVKK